MLPGFRNFFSFFLGYVIHVHYGDLYLKFKLYTWLSGVQKAISLIFFKECLFIKKVLKILNLIDFDVRTGYLF